MYNKIDPLECCFRCVFSRTIQVLGDRVEITGISPSGINTNSVVIASIDRTSATLNADYAGKVRMTLTWNTSAQGAVTDSEGEVRKVVKVAALGSGGSLYAQQVQISGDA